MIYFVLWILVGLISYLAGFKLIPSQNPITRREVLKGTYFCLMGPIVTICLVITYYALETKLTNWLDKEI